MAGYSDNREQYYEMKYLRKVLGEVDETIPVPESVRGSALRQKLDHIQPTAPPAPDKKSGVTFGLHWFSLQSGLTYVAAFALIVGLFYGLGFHEPRPGIEAGDPARPEITQQVEDVPDPVSQLPNGDDPAVSQPPAETDPQKPVEPSGGEPAESSTPASSESSAWGGGGKASTLGSNAGYAYTWRANDAADPDKSGFPVTIDIVKEGSQLVSQIDIPDIQVIMEAMFTETTLSVVGTYEGGVITRCYDISTPEEPVELAVQSQPGGYVNTRVYQDVVHTVTYVPEAAEYECETVQLPHTDAKSACVVSAVNVATGETAQKAFLGADSDISLQNLNVYLFYTGSGDEQAGQEHVGQIRLDGMQIYLGTISE